MFFSQTKMADEEDPIIEEIPVFLSKNLQDSLYLFQYPTKTELQNHDDAVVVNCCIKPYSHEVKVDFGLNIDSKYYDRFKGEQFAVAADGKVPLGAPLSKGMERPSYRRGIMDKQAFTSTRSLTDVSKYIVGIYAEKEVHLSPLTSIVQLRPSVGHFDKEDKRRKAEQKAQTDDTDDDETIQQVTVKFARGGSIAKKAKEQRGYDSFVKQIVDEPWCEAYWYARNTPTAELERQKLYATNHEMNAALTLHPSKYLSTLLPYNEHVQAVEGTKTMQVYNKAMLKTLPLIDQLQVLLKDAKMIRFSDLLDIMAKHIDPHVTADKVLPELPKIAILLHGNWVPMSEVIYPENMLSHANGVSAEQMIRARDYVLFKFSRNQYLCRAQVMAATQLPPAETLDILLTLGRVNASKRWELLLPPDKEFVLKNADLVERQNLIWIATEKVYEEMDSCKETKRIRKRFTRKSESQSQQQPSTMPPPALSTLQS